MDWIRESGPWGDRVRFLLELYPGEPRHGSRGGRRGGPEILDWVPEFLLEPNPLTDFLGYHFVSGNALISASCLFLLAGFVLFLPSKKAQILAGPAVLVGILVLTLCAAPYPASLSGGWYVLLLSWILVEAFFSRFRPLALTLRGTVIGVSLLALGNEFSYRTTPSTDDLSRRPITILGDSLSAGVRFEGEVTWSQILRDRHDVEIQNLSRRGAKTETALNSIRRIPDGPRIILVAIGGNDMLKRRSPDQFEVDLNRLLSRIRTDDRRVFLLELPLPPFQNTYGLVQRRAARAHDVELIPKWILAKALTAKDARVDAIHLSNRGHTILADLMEGILIPPE